MRQGRTRRPRADAVAFALVVACAGCGGTTGLAVDQHSAQSAASGRDAGASASTSAGASTSVDTSASAGASAGTSANASTSACTGGDPYAFLRCDIWKVSGVAWGEPITVMRGYGDPPEPTGGTVTDGAYQLVAETRYGETPPNLGIERPGDLLRSILYAECGVVNLQYMQGGPDMIGPAGFTSGNDCRRLVAQTPPLIQVTGWMVQSGPAIPDARSQVAYTASGSRLTLIELRPYEDFTTIATLGSYTTVREYELIASDGSTHPSVRTAPDLGQPPAPTSGRDPRCPEQPPKDGTRCAPDPAPLECEYGGDAWTRCTTLVRCELDLDGTFHFRKTDATACTPPNPAGCPATFADAQALVAVPVDGGVPVQPALGVTLLPLDQGCNYAEGVCGCFVQGSHPDQERCDWMCRNGGNVAAKPDAECPWPRPHAGDACDEGLQCNYSATCHGPSEIGPSMVCQNGYWATFGGIWHGCPP